MNYEDSVSKKCLKITGVGMLAKVLCLLPLVVQGFSGVPTMQVNTGITPQQFDNANYMLDKSEPDLIMSCLDSHCEAMPQA
eukprot:9027842-Karenia_brevis.AAC.1